MLRYPLEKVNHDLFHIRTFDAGQESVWTSLKLPVPPLRPDLDGIRQAQATKTSDDQQHIEKELTFNGIAERFAPSQEEMLVLGEADTYITPFAYRTKLLFARARPDQLGITPSITTPLHASYPSGHAMQAYTVRDVMTCLHPEKEQKYTQIAEDVAYNRVRAGVHYPSDSVISAELVQQMHCPMMRQLIERQMVPARCKCDE